MNQPRPGFPHRTTCEDQTYRPTIQVNAGKTFQKNSEELKRHGFSQANLKRSKTLAYTTVPTRLDIASKTKIAAQCVASEPGVYFCLQYIVPASNQVSLLGYFLPSPVLVEYKTHTQGHHRQPPKVKSQGLKLQWRPTRYTYSHKSFTT